MQETMADTTSDNDPYQLASNKKQAKKACTDPEERKELVNLITAPLRITFKKPIKSGTEINVAATVKQLFTTMKSADPHITIRALDSQAQFRLSNDDFPTNEDKFKKFFIVHPRSNNPAYKNQVTIGCIIRTSKSIATLKTTNISNGTLIDWLVQHKIFLEDDALGHDVTKVIGFLLRVHPRVVYRDALQETLTLKLQALNITPQKVIELDASAKEHYQVAMDSGDHVATYVPAFELFTTVLGNTYEKKQVTTRVIGIKCNASHHKLLRELFTQLFTNPPLDIAHIKFSLSGIMTVIGAEAYHNLIRDNNQHFDNLATIPVVGITNEHLEIDIPVADPKDPNKRMTLREIIMENDWCSTIETTQVDGKLLITTTKFQLPAARKWIDDGLEPLFTKHLPKNSRFQPHQEYPVPRRTDRIQVTPTTQQYAEKLLTGIPTYAAAVRDNNKFAKFPAKHHEKHPKYIFDERTFPKLKNPPGTDQPAPDTATAATTTTTSTSTDDTHTNDARDTGKLKPKVDLKAIQAELKKSLTTDFTKLINAAINNFKGEMKTSLEKIDNRCDELSTTVGMLNKQYQRLNSTLEQIQNNLPSALQGGDGRA